MEVTTRLKGATSTGSLLGFTPVSQEMMWTIVPAAPAVAEQPIGQLEELEVPDRDGGGPAPEGDQAPAFEMPASGGRTVSLASLKGKPFVLYFYPRADTPGCTTQDCGIRDHRAAYAERGAVVLGVSPDSVKSLRRFVDKYGLDFTLLADPDHTVAEAYGVWAQKTRYGRNYFGVSRTTFVIDAAGKVATVLPKVKPATHDEMVLAALAEL